MSGVKALLKDSIITTVNKNILNTEIVIFLFEYCLAMSQFQNLVAAVDADDEILTFLISNC